MARTATEKPSVLFIVLDSMRKDRLELYGHEQRTTPELDEFADKATVYENAVVPASWTLPSHCSMFTGLAPSEHGVTNGFLDATGTLQVPGEPLAAKLQSQGYRTAGFSNNPWVGGLSGLDTGFDEFVEWNLEIGATDGRGLHGWRDRLYSKLHTLLGHASRQPLFLLKRRFFTQSLVERACRWLKNGNNDPDNERSFTFLNLMEAHSPYFPPRSAFRDLGLDAPGPLEPRILNTRLLSYVMGRSDLDQPQRDRVFDYYDASLHYQDQRVGHLLEEFSNTHALNDALVIICADHGKTLGEYDRDTSPPHYLRDINTDVPLVIKYPGQREGRRVSDVVELTRLHDLIRDGGDRPLEAYTPESTDGGSYGVVEEFIPHTGRETESVTMWRALVGREYKYLSADSGESYLIDRVTRSEPEQTVDEPDRAARMRELLDERVRNLQIQSSDSQERPEDAESGLGGDVEAQLEDLGYI